MTTWEAQLGRAVWERAVLAERQGRGNGKDVYSAGQGEFLAEQHSRLYEDEGRRATVWASLWTNLWATGDYWCLLLIRSSYGYSIGRLA